MFKVTEGVLARDMRSTARAMRMIDDRDPGHVELLKQLYPHTGNAFVLGITGNPGAGKSTLTDRLIDGYRKQGKRVGVICVDPSSPYTGGAILGDRIRMARHSSDEGVFIRSVATRGHLGGLSRSAREMVRVLDAWGADLVLVETVGVGQDELEITRTAHSTLVVMAPGMGDEVQAIKAGLMESADVFAVNKADRDGADSTVRDLELMISLGSEALIAMSKVRGHLAHGASAAVEAAAHGVAGTEMRADATHWVPPICKCVATRNEGIAPLIEALETHRRWILDTPAGQARRRARLAEEMRDSLREALIEAAVAQLRTAMDAAIARVAERELDPYSAVEQLLVEFRARPAS